ncbi:MAG: SurA N-terminal domain-containing protein [Planctomycetota bacterium]|jgi:hypothetical protein
MNPQRFVRKHSKIILGGLVAVMAISLVVGFSSFGNVGDEELARIEGTLHGTKEVTKLEFLRAARESRVYHRWNYFTRSRFRGEPPRLEEKELRKVTWEYLVLIEEARRQQIFVSEEETLERIRQYFTMLFRQITGREITAEIYSRQVRSMFGVEAAFFEKVMVNIVRIEKLFELLTQADFRPYEEVYRKILDESRRARVRVAAFDHRAFEKDLCEPRPDELHKEYNRNKEQYKTPQKVKVAYAIVTRETFEEKVRKDDMPTQEDCKEYYEKYRKQFPRPREPKEEEPGHEGHDHGEEAASDDQPAEDEYKSFEEVNEEIFDLIVEERADEMVQDLIGRIEKTLGEFETVKKPDEIRLKEVIADFLEAEEPVRYGVTPWFDRTEAETVEEIEELGSGTGLADWAFESDPHEFSQKKKTDEGWAFFQLLEKKEEQYPGLALFIEEELAPGLREKQLRERARKEADRIRTLIERKGLGRAAEEENLSFETSNYFDVRGSGPVGLKDAEWDYPLRNYVRGHAISSPPGIGRVNVVSGANVYRGDPEKQNWSFLVYLDDVVPEQDVDLTAKFSERYRSELGQHREQRRASIVARLSALVNDLGETESPEKGKSP